VRLQKGKSRSCARLSAAMRLTAWGWWERGPSISSISIGAGGQSVRHRHPSVTLTRCQLLERPAPLQPRPAQLSIPTLQHTPRPSNDQPASRLRRPSAPTAPNADLHPPCELPASHGLPSPPQARPENVQRRGSCGHLSCSPQPTAARTPPRADCAEPSGRGRAATRPHRRPVRQW
jgi:hypothetical protein